MKEFAKRAYDQLAVLSGLASLGRRQRRKAVTIVTYHGLRPAEPVRAGRLPSDMELSVDMFEAHLHHLAACYRVVTLRALVAWLGGGPELPDGAVVLAFDDGYRSNFTLGFPLLRRFGFPATVFVTTDFVDREIPRWWDVLLWATETTRETSVTPPGSEPGARLPLVTREDRQRVDAAARALIHRTREPERAAALRRVLEALAVDPARFPRDEERFRPLTWEEIGTMAEAGIEIGAHTASHPVLAHLPAAAREAELVSSKRLIEGKLGRPVESFCYPYGWSEMVDDVTRTLLVETGYRCALTSVLGLVRGGDDPFTLQRLGTRPSLSGFVTDVAGVSAALLRRRRRSV
jgi:peptidoglycan/xylan/chitin deacetylase (PgdA/CDA1 family)